MTRRKSSFRPGLLIAGLVGLLVVGMLVAVVVVVGADVEETGDAETGRRTADVDRPPDDDDDDTEDRPTRRTGSDGGADASVAATLRGVVRVYRTREPAGGVELSLTFPLPEGSDEGAEAMQLTSVTDAAGVFEFTGLQPIAGTVLHGEVEPYAAIHIGDIALLPQETTDLGTLWLAVPVDLPVLVTDLAGKPVGGAAVSVYALSGGFGAMPDAEADESTQGWRGIASAPSPGGTATTDDAGHATVAGLMPGRYHLRATADDHGPATRSGILLAPEKDQRRVQLLLTNAHVLSGRVLNAANDPVEGARVMLAPGDSKQPGADKLEATSDEEGRYRIDGLAPGQHLVIAVAPEHPPVQAGRVTIPHHTHYDVRLPATGTLFGIVTDGAGAPVQDAQLEFTQAKGGRAYGATDAEGAYRIEHVVAGAISAVRVRAAGYVPAPDPTAPQAPVGLSIDPAEEVEWNVTLERGETVEVTVTAAESGEPIVGVVVNLHPVKTWGSTQADWSATTENDGVARLRGLVSGPHLAVLTAEGRVQDGLPTAWGQLLRQPEALPPAWRVDVVRGEVVRVAYEMGAGASVTGRVLQADGEPAAGVLVSVPGSAATFPAFSGEDGTYRVDGIPASLRAVARAQPEGRPIASSEPFVVPDAGVVEDIEITLAGAGRVQGRVRTSDGARARGAFVRVNIGEYSQRSPRRLDRFLPLDRTAVSDDGSFLIEDTPTGKVTVRADAEGYLPAWQTVEAVAGQVVTVGDLILDVERVMSGRVEDASGNPVAGATVTASFTGTFTERRWGFASAHGGNPFAQTADDGTFTLAGLAEGKYRVSATADGYGSAPRVETTTSDGEIVLQLRDVGRITGVVVDPDGEPMPGITVSARDSSSGGGRRRWWGGTRVTTSQDGTFAFERLTEETYTLSVSGSSSWSDGSNIQDTTVEGVRVGTTDVEIIVEAGRTIAGTVIDDSDDPVTLGWVTANSEGGGGGSRWARIGADGTYELRGLGTTSYKLTASGAFTAQSRQGVAAGSSGIELRVIRSLSIRGVVTAEGGIAVAGRPGIRGRPAGSEEWQRVQYVHGGDGAFVITQLEDRAYDLRFTLAPYAPVELSNVVAGSEGVVVSMRTGKSISGRIVDSNAAPIAGWVYATQTDAPDGAIPSSARSRAKDTGEFEVEGLVDGTYKVVVRANEHAVSIAHDVIAGAGGLEYRLEVGTTVGGKVVDSAGNPVHRPRVQLYIGDDSVGWTRGDESGAFTFVNVPESGSLRITGSVTHGGQRVSFTKSDGVSQGDTSIEVRLPQ